jgi:hypothetical protein
MNPWELFVDKLHTIPKKLLPKIFGEIITEIRHMKVNEETKKLFNEFLITYLPTIVGLQDAWHNAGR